MNTNMTGLDGFQISLFPCALEESSSIGRVNPFMPKDSTEKKSASSFSLKIF